MIYASIDIETTGIDNENTQTLSIGIVVENTVNCKPVEEDNPTQKGNTTKKGLMDSKLPMVEVMER